ncbi:uncharacterized protein HMPREF1541_04418 [Cyphellophora europaea CBS 101466]|uniref:Zn(2)-C6 fungal-type domain-containing protein n=1 Tax=Cyphellophora europaea (strain CBS 101466) TaxID=1220924 RepID=W2RUL7_CYPE1|nr:uncharacterized protein HMPREF1541_04418 [Cyphellophora europaea CBS 101466]ETN40142.1 hypothetical protein HMPREF1541_04418 [Cyphellophora europaea CBS 101466]
MASWHQPPSQYSEPPEHRPPPQDLPPQQSYPPPGHHPPPPHSQTPYPQPPTRENSGPYPPDPAYSRQGSVSAPTRSPAEPQHNRYPPPGSAPPPHESPYYSQAAAPEYHRPPVPYGPPDSQPNGTHPPPPLHVQTGHEMMGGQPGAPPPPHSHHGYGHAPPHSAPPPPTPGGYYPQYYDSAQQRRKPVRAAQACDSCRQRKAKCDEGRPECQHCKDNNLKCTYREMPPQKSEKQVMQITEKLESLADNVNLLVANQKSQQQQIQKLLDMQSALGGNSTNFQSSQTVPPSRPPMPNFKSEETQAHARANFEETADKEEGDPEDKGEKLEYSMPPKHTTAVHHMFEWPLIQALIPKNQSNTYVMDTELSRGLLRLYGCGEGEDKGDGHEGAPSPANSQSSEGRIIDDETTSSSPHGVWGNGQLPPPPTSNEQNAREHPGGLSPRGGLMLDSEAVDLYFRSYMDNMHILHPFLEPRVLRKMIHDFKRKYSWDYRPHHATAQVTGAKRKREATDSPTPLDEIPSTFAGGRPHSRAVNSSMIEHSVANAIVLLVIALGKVCGHKEPLPGPASTATIRTSTPHTMYSTLSDLPHNNTKSAPASPYHQPNGNHAAVAVSSPSNPQGKNMDVIPGLSYFAKAADIIGELPGGVDVSHIQANLLAGLYMGQLARIIASHYYISVACRACQILIESTAYRRNEMSKSRRNLINFAFWSCLQLESDILAEVELPPSGITRYEGRQHQEMPNNVTLDTIPEGGREDILRFYSYQIQLRRTMNDIHSMLYRRAPRQNPKPVLALVGVLETNLQSWRAMLMDWDWDDDDHESPHINMARMRAKYYGARYIIHRPMLHFCLRMTAPTTPSIKHSDSPQASDPSAFPSPIQPGYSPAGRGRRYSEMGPPSLGRAPIPIAEEILTSARKCVQAAIRSTTSFDKVPKRLIITNIFGTAHAQFGNMLVLAATYTSPHPDLSSMVNESTLRHLFHRTLGILQANESISPVLAKDFRILQQVRANVFPDTKPSMSSSFSSR